VIVLLSLLPVLHRGPSLTHYVVLTKSKIEEWSALENHLRTFSFSRDPDGVLVP
jgi:hypothetical protein